MVDTPEIHNLAVSTPIEEFTKHDSGSVIDIASTLHVGSPFYFDRLHAYASQRASEGFVIFEEAIGEASEEEQRQANVRERLKYKLLMTGASYAMRAIIGVEDSDHFTHQGRLVNSMDDGLEPSQCINVDVTEMDIARAASFYGLLRGIHSSRKFFKKLERAYEEGPVAYDNAIYKALVEEFRSSKAKQEARPKKKDQAMVYNRNQVVLEHIDTLLAQDPAARIALLWGYGHRRGLTNGLQERGYRCTRVASLTVAFNPSPRV